MKFLKNVFIGIGAVALAWVLLTLAAPKTVHAAVATLVEIANTPANPVPNADVNAPGEEAFQALLCGTNPSSGCGTVPDTLVVPSTTSDGLNFKRLVLEYVSGFCQSSGSVSQINLDFTTTINENAVGTLTQVSPSIPLTPSSPGSPLLAFSEPVRAYADPGTTVGVGSSFFGGNPYCEVNFVGHYLTH
jgi:hypothetical protein